MVVSSSHNFVGEAVVAVLLHMLYRKGLLLWHGKLIMFQ